MTPTPGAGAGSASSGEMTTTRKGPSTGEIIGIVVGVIGAVALVAAAFFCLYFARRRKGQEEREDDAASQRGSSAGMMGSRRPEMSSTVPSSWESGDGDELGKRRSRLMPVDPRMDPFNGGIYTRNKSHESIATLRDDQDYSRKVHQPKILRATNPDPQVDE